jgi:hypothetical protein
MMSTNPLRIQIVAANEAFGLNARYWARSTRMDDAFPKKMLNNSLMFRRL